MILDYIEIGTSDFDTLVQNTDLTGLSIDPLKIYLDALPNKVNNIKINAAISDFDGFCDVYYIDPKDIESYNLPGWLRGCNSIQNPHPSALKVLNELGLTTLYQKTVINTLSWDTLVRTKNIVSVEFLKIDTEGHDHIIIKSVLESTTNILPKKITFETNTLTPENIISETISSLIDRGYEVIEKTHENTTVLLSEKIIDKIIFSSDSNPDYIEFWGVNSKVCSKKLKITPVLFHICDEDSDFYWDDFGLVKKVKRVSDNTGFEAQIFRMYGTKYFMDDICLTSDIDMLILDRDFILNEKIDRDSITILNSDAYDSERPECVNQYAGPDRYPICYIAATGKIFNSILNTSVSFFEYHTRLLKLDKGFDTDEIYFGVLVNKTGIRVNKIKRGYCTNFFAPKRIEKRDFNQKDVFSLDLDGFIDVKNFIDCHCARPYSLYREQIDNLVNKLLS